MFTIRFIPELRNGSIDLLLPEVNELIMNRAIALQTNALPAGGVAASLVRAHHRCCHCHATEGHPQRMAGADDGADHTARRA